jgi:hypothetical protein
VTLDHSYAAMIDSQCSLVVYSGNVDAFIKYVFEYEDNYNGNINSDSSSYRGGIAFTTKELVDLFNIEVLFRSESFASLQGNCFAGLDEVGVFRIFRGHPGYSTFSTIWASQPLQTSWENTFVDSIYPSTYKLVLQGNGELVILKFTTPGLRNDHYHGSGGSSSNGGSGSGSEGDTGVKVECKWSSASSRCGAVESAVHRARMHTAHLFWRSVSQLQHMRSLFMLHFLSASSRVADVVRRLIKSLSKAFNTNAQQYVIWATRQAKQIKERIKFIFDP